MVTTQETIQSSLAPSYITERQQQLLNNLFGTTSDPSGGAIDASVIPPAQQVAQFTPTQQQAFNLAQTGLGSFEPFLAQSNLAAQLGLGTATQGQQALQGMDFTPGGAQQFMDPYQKAVTDEAVKEIDRQAAMAQNQLAGQAAKAGAFGGSRFGIQQSELARNAADLKSRRVFEDMSRNYQMAMGQQRALNQQRMQQAQQFGNLGQVQTGIGKTFGQIGQALQSGRDQNVNQLLGIGGLQQQLAQTGLDIGRQNIIEQQQEPFRKISFGSQILQGLTPGAGITQQTISPMPVGNPYLQAAGAITGLGTGLGALIGN